jgi:hypothetical protein
LLHEFLVQLTWKSPASNVCHHINPVVLKRTLKSLVNLFSLLNICFEVSIKSKVYWKGGELIAHFNLFNRFDFRVSKTNWDTHLNILHVFGKLIVIFVKVVSEGQSNDAGHKVVDRCIMLFGKSLDFLNI